MLINNEFIHVVPYLVENPQGTIIFSHGIAEHHLRYKELIKTLNTANYNVIAYDLRGHGRSGGKRGYVKSVNHFITDLSEIINYTKQNHKTKIYLLGHSMGALIINLYVINNKTVDGVIISGAAGDFAKNTNFLRIIPAKFLWYVKIKTKFNDPNLTSDLVNLEEVTNDPFLLPSFYLTLIGETMIKGIRRIKRNYDKITLPYLFLQGEKDKIILPESNEKLYHSIKSGDKKRIVYPEMYHNILNDSKSEQVYKDIITWLDER